LGHPERSEGSAFSSALNDMASPRKQQMLRFAEHDPAMDARFFHTF
jgi:hypothetical protein